MSKPEKAAVVVIGGGVVGCAILYHLARRGMRDALLFERRELTAGSSWHAAGNLAALTMPSNAATLQRETIEHYPELEDISGQRCDVHIVGGLYLSRTQDQTHQLRRMDSQAMRSGVETRFIDAAEARDLVPILDTEGIDSILFETLKGYCDPSSVTHAYAKAARRLGASIRNHCPVTATVQLPDGGWRVETGDGVIEADYLVNAAGLWGREVAAMAGIQLPLMPVEHHYLVTDSLPELEALPREIAHVSEPGGGYYLRQEGKGLLLGIYEDRCTLWSEAGTPLNFGHELLPDDLSRAEQVIEHVMRAIPPMQNAGIKRVVNGPMILTPDLAPLVGPHPALRNYFCACGVMSGFNQGGGIGRIIADWILEGEPGLDVHFWDVARFGDWADADYTAARVRYGYEHRQKVYYPFEEVNVARGKVTSAVYGALVAKGAVHGAVFGMEHPLWYAQTPADAQDRYDFDRGNWFDAVGAEVEAVRCNVGLIDVSAFAKYFVRGAGAFAWLDRVLAGRIPETIGKTALCPMLSPRGRLIGDFTITRLAEDHFVLLGSSVMQASHMRWFRDQLPVNGLVSVDNVTQDFGGLHLAGPRARDFLQTLTSRDVGTDALPFLSALRLDIEGICGVLAVRVSFTGELGYELYCPRADHPRLLDHVLDAGHAFGLKLAGGRAMGSMRIEKGFGSWGPDLSPDFLPTECGIDRFVSTAKSNFIGRDAYLRAAQEPVKKRFRQFTVATDTRDCFGGEAIYQDDRFVGYVTSAAFGHATQQSIALGYVEESSDPDRGYEIDLLGQRVAARLQKTPLYDPTGKRMRA